VRRRDLRAVYRLRSGTSDAQRYCRGTPPSYCGATEPWGPLWTVWARVFPARMHLALPSARSDTSLLLASLAVWAGTRTDVPGQIAPATKLILC